MIDLVSTAHTRHTFLMKKHVHHAYCAAIVAGLMLSSVVSSQAGSIRRIGQNSGSSRAKLKNTRRIIKIGESRSDIVRIGQSRQGVKAMQTASSDVLRARHVNAFSRYRR